MGPFQLIVKTQLNPLVIVPIFAGHGPHQNVPRLRVISLGAPH